MITTKHTYSLGMVVFAINAVANIASKNWPAVANALSTVWFLWLLVHSKS